MIGLSEPLFDIFKNVTAEQKGVLDVSSAYMTPSEVEATVFGFLIMACFVVAFAALIIDFTSALISHFKRG